MCIWRKQWQHTPVLLPGKSHWQRRLVGCSPWGRQKLDTTEWLTFTFHFHALEKEMATHSSVLTWRIPGMGEPGGLPSKGLHRVGHDWSDLAAAAATAVYVCQSQSPCPFPSLTSPPWYPFIYFLRLSMCFKVNYKYHAKLIQLCKV